MCQESEGNRLFGIGVNAVIGRCGDIYSRQEACEMDHNLRIVSAASACNQVNRSPNDAPNGNRDARRSEHGDSGYEISYRDF